MAYVKYQPMFVMARHCKYRQMVIYPVDRKDPNILLDMTLTVESYCIGT